MKVTTTHAWTARIDVKEGQPNGHTWTRHHNLTVIAKTPERAVELIRESFPGCNIWALNHVGGNGSHVVFDEAEIAAPVAP